MIVVVIIGILSAIAIPKFAQVKEEANQASCRCNIRSLAGAEMMYYAKAGSFTDLHGLQNSRCLLNASSLVCPEAHAVYDINHSQTTYLITCPNADPNHGSMTDGLASW